MPIIIIIGVWIFLMRRMSGGAGGAGGQIFNIGKSKAKLFDQNTHVKINYKFYSVYLIMVTNMCCRT